MSDPAAQLKKYADNFQRQKALKEERPQHDVRRMSLELLEIESQCSQKEDESVGDNLGDVKLTIGQASSNTDPYVATGKGSIHPMRTFGLLEGM
jgi:hypothetical protein